MVFMTDCTNIQQKMDELDLLKQRLAVAMAEAAKSGNMEEVRKLKEEFLEKMNELKKEMDPYSAWNEYKDGETMLMIGGTPTGNDWELHPRGVVLNYNNSLHLGGETLVRGGFSKWSSHPRGVVVQRGKRLLLNDKELLYEGDFKGWGAHPRGVVIWKGNQLLLNGTELLYEGDFVEWRPHPKGVVIRTSVKNGVCQLLLNGKKLLYEGPVCHWEPYPDGVVIKDKQRFLLNNKELLYEGPYSDWRAHPKGVVIKNYVFGAGNPNTQQVEWTFHNQSMNKEQQ